jgi:hypothetical protein
MLLAEVVGFNRVVRFILTGRFTSRTKARSKSLNTLCEYRPILRGEPKFQLPAFKCRQS